MPRKPAVNRSHQELILAVMQCFQCRSGDMVTVLQLCSCLATSRFSRQMTNPVRRLCGSCRPPLTGFWTTLKATPFCGNWGLTRRIATIRRKRALNLSIARYVIMVVQFVLLLNAFGHHASMDHWVGRMFEQVEGVSLTWGLTSLVPMPALGDLGIREAAALLTIPAPEPLDATAIIGATLTLWVLNILIPALVGLVWHASAQRRINGLRTNLGA